MFSESTRYQFPKMKREILKETARDIIALGSPVFFILVIARIFLLSNFAYLSEFIISGILFIPLMYFLKANIYSGLGLIVLIFTGIYYDNLNFAIFAAFIYILLVVSLICLKEDKTKVIKGIILGLVSAGVGYYLVKLIF